MKEVLFMILVFIPPVALYLITMGLYGLYLTNKEKKENEQ